MCRVFRRFQTLNANEKNLQNSCGTTAESLTNHIFKSQNFFLIPSFIQSFICKNMLQHFQNWVVIEFFQIVMGAILIWICLYLHLGALNLLFDDRLHFLILFASFVQAFLIKQIIALSTQLILIDQLITYHAFQVERCLPFKVVCDGDRILDILASD